MAKNGKHTQMEYVDLKDGRYYTKQALADKYQVSEWTIRNRVKEFGIATAQVFGTELYKDDPRYVKQQPKGNTESLPKISGYAAMFHKVENIESDINEIKGLLIELCDTRKLVPIKEGETNNDSERE